jgi:hypothetical protein
MTKPPAGPRRLRAMPLSLHVLPLVASALLIAACAGSPAASTAPSANQPVSAPSLRPAGTLAVEPSAATADYTGILSMDAIEGGCAYLQGATGTKYQVLYPDGWQLNTSPLELLAPDGSVHSKGGDTVSIKGSEAGGMASICQIGPIIQATEVLDR